MELGASLKYCDYIAFGSEQSGYLLIRNASDFPLTKLSNFQALWYVQCNRVLILAINFRYKASVNNFAFTAIYLRQSLLPFISGSGTTSSMLEARHPK
jgi:hypothetical protein